AVSCASFFLTPTSPPYFYPLSLHDALPICTAAVSCADMGSSTSNCSLLARTSWAITSRIPLSRPASSRRKCSSCRTARANSTPQRRLCLVADVVLGPALESLDALLDGGRRADRLGDLRDLFGVDVVEHGKAQLVLVAEVGVDRALGEPGRFRHLLQRRGAVTVAQEQLLGRGHQLRAGARLPFGPGQSCHDPTVLGARAHPDVMRSLSAISALR